MTHFRTVVLVPKNVWTESKDAVNSYIDEQMAPYMETGAGCSPEYCEFEITHKKKNFKIDAAKIIKGLSKDRDTEGTKLLEEYKAKFKKKDYIGIFDSWEGGDVKDGHFGHYNNPNSFYDYYRVGGRWDGLITGAPKESPDGFNFGDEYEDLERNSVKVKDLLNVYKAKENSLKPMNEAKEYIAKILEGKDGFWGFGYAKPFRDHFKKVKEEKWKKLYEDVGKTIAKELRDYDGGIFWNEFLISKIVADGEVHECDDVGWFGMSTPKKSRDEWVKEYEELLEAHIDDIAVSLDCHV